MSRMGNHIMGIKESVYRYYDDEMEALEKLLDANEITQKQFDQAVRELTYAVREQEEAYFDRAP